MYGLLISLAIFISLIIGERLAARQKLNLSTFWGTALWSILGAIIGARLYHVINFYNYYLENPLLILFTFNGGLGIFGGLIGGLFGALLFLKKKRENYLVWLDILAVITPLGQAIGRLGNLFNNELFGLPTNLPWGVYIPREFRPNEYLINDVFHPLSLYESAANLSLFILLYYLYNRKIMTKTQNVDSKTLYIQNGFFLFTYSLSYGVIRFFLEFLRINPWKIYNFNVAQTISVVCILIPIFFLIRHLPYFDKR